MNPPDFLSKPHDPRDPDPWMALYLDQSTPLPDAVKAVWLRDSSSRSRQFLLPFVRPLARAFIILIQVLKTVLPKRWAHSPLLHRFLAWGLEHFVSPQANWLILRHFHIGSQILAFVAKNAPVEVETSPLKPAGIADLRDEMFLKHDLNLFNFVIRLNTALREAGKEIEPVRDVDLSMIEDPPIRLADMPHRTRNFLDLESAIELFTPLYQLMLTDNDFWRAANSLQLDETLGLYAAKITNAPQHLILVNNKHPLVALSTLRAGYRLVLHGLSSEMLHGLLMQAKAGKAAAHAPGPLAPDAPTSTESPHA